MFGQFVHIACISWININMLFLVAAKPTTLVETNSSGLCFMVVLNDLLTTNSFSVVRCEKIKIYHQISF